MGPLKLLVHVLHLGVTKPLIDDGLNLQNLDLELLQTTQACVELIQSHIPNWMHHFDLGYY
jgi:hypothetical protein